ncbi:MAG: hypothetical protein KatS3mg076_2791 [Candidatus Binatia bacterium]|nr:MAG: hypothetical protein KatS3mg076_2791 [Candidatus Binatia bacterium]
MPSFELDMNFPVAELLEGTLRILGKRGAKTGISHEGPDAVVLDTELRGVPLRIEIRSIPPERRAPFAFGPRSLLRASCEATGTDLEELRREIVLAFLRVAG